MALATSNLAVSTILTTLGVTSPRAIFYKGVNLDTLKTIDELKDVVAHNGLSSYCPGANSDAKITSLLNARNLTYFKGYNHYLLRCNPTNIDFAISNNSPVTINVISSMSWNISKSNSWIIVSTNTGSGNGSFTINVSNNPLGGNYRVGTVTINASIVTITITIGQEGMPV